jgi:hypothetical protein
MGQAIATGLMCIITLACVPLFALSACTFSPSDATAGLRQRSFHKIAREITVPTCNPVSA